MYKKKYQKKISHNWNKRNTKFSHRTRHNLHLRHVFTQKKPSIHPLNPNVSSSSFYQPQHRNFERRAFIFTINRWCLIVRPLIVLKPLTINIWSSGVMMPLPSVTAFVLIFTSHIMSPYKRRVSPCPTSPNGTIHLLIRTRVEADILTKTRQVGIDQWFSC